MFVSTSNINAIEIDFVGYVDNIIDGKSFYLTSGERIWLADVTTQNISDTSEAFSREYLEKLIQGRKVYLERSRLNDIVNGSLACLVYIDYQTYYFMNVNMEMVTNGGCVIQDLFNSFDPTYWQRVVLHTIPLTKTSYSLSIDMPDGLGTTYPPMGTQKYSVGLVISISANPLPGWKLAYWMLDGNYAGSHNPLMVTMTADHLVRAFFIQTSTDPTPKKHVLTITPPVGEGYTTPITGTYEYGNIIDILVTAEPAEGWEFSHWVLNNREIGSLNPFNLTVDSLIDLKASFNKINYTLTTNSIGEGLILKTPDKNFYNYGDTVKIIAQAKAGYVFSGWNGSLTGTNNPATIIISGNRTVTAKFIAATEPKYTITIQSSQGQGSTTPASGNYQYNGNEIVNIIATPMNGWLFDYWAVNGSLFGNINSLNISVQSNIEIKAFFKLAPIKNVTLTLQVSGNGVTTPSSGLSKFNEGSTVFITANPSVGWSFSNWILDGTNIGSLNPIAVEMNKDHTIIAVFKESQQQSPLSGIPSYPEISIITGLLISILYIYLIRKDK